MGIRTRQPNVVVVKDAPRPRAFRAWALCARRARGASYASGPPGYALGFSGDPDAEQRFCRVGICDTWNATAGLEQQFDVASPQVFHRRRCFRTSCGTPRIPVSGPISPNLCSPPAGQPRRAGAWTGRSSRAGASVVLGVRRGEFISVSAKRTQRSTSWRRASRMRRPAGSTPSTSIRPSTTMRIASSSSTRSCDADCRTTRGCQGYQQVNRRPLGGLTIGRRGPSWSIMASPTIGSRPTTSSSICAECCARRVDRLDALCRARPSRRIRTAI